MNSDGAYPPGVTGDMIDDYYGANEEETEDQAVEHFLEELKEDGCLKCEAHKCDWITDLLEGFLDKEFRIGNDQYEFLRLRCSLCGNMESEKRDTWLNNEWDNWLDWVNGIWPRFSCAWCHVPFKIYGKYKDPDDEWNAIDSKENCSRCKYFDDEKEIEKK